MRKTRRRRPRGGFLAEADGETVGSPGTGSTPKPSSPATAPLAAVAHRARRRGVGRRCSPAGKPRPPGVPAAFWSRQPGEPDGLAFALRHGFTEVEGEVSCT